MNMKIKKITRTTDLVRMVFEITGDDNKTIDRDDTIYDVPMKSFDEALQGLAAVAVKVLELPPEYADGITVTGLAISYTKAGTKTATVKFTKALDATSTNHGMDTPGFQIDDAGQGEEGRRQVTPKHAERVLLMIEEAEKYINGERSQMQLPLPEDRKKKVAADGGQLELKEEGRTSDDDAALEGEAGEPQPEEEAPEKPAKKKRGRPKKKA